MNRNDQLLIDAVNARLAELARQHQPDHTPWIAAAIFVVFVLCGVWLVFNWKRIRGEHRMRNLARRGATATPVLSFNDWLADRTVDQDASAGFRFGGFEELRKQYELYLRSTGKP